jgi:hypothetical protein
MRTLKLIMLSALAAAGVATGGNPPAVNQAIDRGRTPIQGVTMPPAEREYALNATPRQFSGTLIDAGCHDRSLLNLGFAPEPLSSSLAEAGGKVKDHTSAGGVSAFGITVSRQTLEGERADAMAHQVPDIRTRQSDPSCAVTGSTKEFSLLLANGRLLNLDPGGSTFAWQAVFATSEGRAMLNGFAPGLKPYATMRGYLQGSTLVVQHPFNVQPSSQGFATRMKTP